MKLSISDIMMFVLLESPSCYLVIHEATSKKHFTLVDSGWHEHDSGTYEEMEFWKDLYESKDRIELIELRTPTSLIQTTESMLKLQLDIDPNWLDDKIFVE